MAQARVPPIPVEAVGDAQVLAHAAESSRSTTAAWPPSRSTTRSATALNRLLDHRGGALAAEREVTDPNGRRYTVDEGATAVDRVAHRSRPDPHAEHAHT
ncbi:hypothetical protein [Embleya sp. NPDC020630]|uniref:hypothetical protein n=1 Tax=Embleya sp. NPDC020630 TaxID=3363979 RepID=UPI0037ADA1B8